MSDDILSRIDEAMARNAARYDPLGGRAWDEDRVERLGDGVRTRQAEAGIEEAPEPAEAVADLAVWAATLDDRQPADAPYRCRGCRLWIAQNVKLCGPCSALPSCRAERSAVEWGGTAVCFRPDGHDGQHETVQGRCWMDAPSQVEALRREPFLMAAIDAERDRLVKRIEDELAQRLTLARAVRRPWWKRWLP